MYSFYELCFLFFLFAFLGWCGEVCFAALESGKLVNRGFLNGPVCPIYGFGVVLVAMILGPFAENTVLLFFLSIVVCSLLELVAGYLLETLFGQRWWDYSDEHFNIGGYICLRFSILWGFGCLFVFHFLFPPVFWLIHAVPKPVGTVILLTFFAVSLVDCIATISTIMKMNRDLSLIDELAAQIHHLSDALTEEIGERTLLAAEKGRKMKDNLDDLKEEIEDKSAAHYMQWQIELDQLRLRLEETLSRRNFGRGRILRAFPTMRSKHHSSALARLREYFDKKK